MRYRGSTRETKKPTSGMSSITVKPPGDSAIPDFSALYPITVCMYWGKRSVVLKREMPSTKIMTFDAAKFAFLNIRTSTTGFGFFHSQMTNETSDTAAMMENHTMSGATNHPSSSPLSRTTSSVPSPIAMSPRPT